MPHQPQRGAAGGAGPGRAGSPGGTGRDGTGAGPVAVRGHGEQRGGGGGRRESAVRRHAVGSEKAPFGWEQMAGWGADRV